MMTMMLLMVSESISEASWGVLRAGNSSMQALPEFQASSRTVFAIVVAAVALLISASWLSFLHRRRSLPPGPPPWPILGNLPDLSFLPHRCLANLGDRFGPALTVWLGSVPCVVFSSPELAREVLKTKDKVCSSRPHLRIVELMSHGGKDLIFAPPGDHWRLLRRLAAQHLLSPRNVHESLPVRERQIRYMLDAIAREANNGDVRGVELRAYLNRATMNQILWQTLGKEYTYDTIPRAAAAAPGEMLAAAMTIDWEKRIAAIRGGRSPLASTHTAASAASVEDVAGDEMEGEAVIAMIDEAFKVMGAFNLVDFLPWLTLVDPQRTYQRASRLKIAFEQFVLACIEERIVTTQRGEKEEGGGGKCCNEEGLERGEKVLVDALLEMEGEGEDEVSKEGKREDRVTREGTVTREGRITRENTVLLCQDLLGGGTDTTAKTVEWALAELACHPDMLEKLQAEVDAAYAKSAAEAAAAAGRGGAAAVASTDRGGGGAAAAAAGIGESCLPVGDMAYLQAVIKETLRHHPLVPLLIPRMPSDEVTIGGYTIPPNTIILINAWRLTHEPTVWNNPHEFDPTRFLGASAPDVFGQNFSLLPFGSGRRGCPGITLGLDQSARMLAAFVRRFDFSLPEDVVASGGLDMEEEFSLSIALAKPLRVKLQERNF